MLNALIGISTFIFTFAIGFFLVPVSHEQSTVSVSKVELVESPPLATTGGPNQPLEDDFNPEFRDLPDVEFAFVGATDNLIDVFETGGTYRESEVIAKSGEEWLTLFEKNGKFSLATSRTRVVKKSTISYPGDEFDVELSFDKPGTPIFAVRRLWWLPKGPVRTIYHRPSSEEISRRLLPIQPMQTGYKRDFNLNENWYTLRVSSGQTVNGEKRSVLVLENNGTSQVIAQNYDHIIGELLWVGDLDNDGKLDLYFDEFNEKGYFGVGLYLSSSAGSGMLVKLVATFGVAGC